MENEMEQDEKAYQHAVKSTDSAVAVLNVCPTLANAEAVSDCYDFESDMSKDYYGYRVRRDVSEGMNPKARRVYRYWWKKALKRFNVKTVEY